MVVNEDEFLNETVQCDENLQQEYESSLKFLTSNCDVRRNRPGTSNMVSFNFFLLMFDEIFC
jgi:hypothetical protein